MPSFERLAGGLLMHLGNIFVSCDVSTSICQGSVQSTYGKL
jgi:hypothetical protein